MSPERSPRKSSSAAAPKASAPKASAPKASAPKASPEKTRPAKKPTLLPQSKPEQPAVKATAGALAELGFANPAAFDRWLAGHHADKAGIWLKIAKKGSGVASVTYAEALEVALTWGWIDGQTQAKDDRFFLRKFSPRAPRSIWSKINREKALALVTAGKMHPPGLEQVQRAQQDGRFAAAYDSPKNAQPPPDLAAALAQSRRARAFYDELEARNRYAIVFRVQTAKRPETRARRISEIIAMLERGERFHP